MQIHVLRNPQRGLGEPIPGIEISAKFKIGDNISNTLDTVIRICRQHKTTKGHYAYISFTDNDLRLLREALVRLTPHEHLDGTDTSSQVRIYTLGLLAAHLQDYNAGVNEFPQPYIGYIDPDAPHRRKRKSGEGKLVIVVPPLPDLLVSRREFGE